LEYNNSDFKYSNSDWNIINSNLEYNNSDFKYSNSDFKYSNSDLEYNLVRLKILLYIKGMTFVNSRKYRQFESTEFGINIPPDYSDKDLFDFKQGSKHSKVKIGFTNGRKVKRVY
jgi:hypothetical protein